MPSDLSRELREERIERQWFHAKHGLHDDAHHQHHDAIDVCVPLVFYAEAKALLAKADAAEGLAEAVENYVRFFKGKPVAAASKIAARTQMKEALASYRTQETQDA